MLKRYGEKRDFTKTPEPSGASSGLGRGPLRFVVQKHAARRLHYDVRLELDGVLLSWAVPKGPSVDPEDKHLAVHVEDHPFDYRDFEGRIPKGEYGGGEVIVWDEGVYSPDDKGVLSFDDREEAARRMREDLAKGKLSITFRGHKLSGSWTIVKTSGKEDDQWLMIKHRDGMERPGHDLTAQDRSVKTGRTIEDVREGRPGTWLRPEDAGAAKVAIPEIRSPMLATEERKPFSRAGWGFELKIDGIRAIAHVRNREVIVFSRNGNDITFKFPRLVRELRQLPYESFILDGEVVCFDEAGKPSFQRLLERFQLQDPRAIESMESKLPIEFCVFDLLYFEGWDVRGCKLRERRALLEQMNPRTTTIRVLDQYLESGELLFDHAIQLGFEGVVGKKLDSKYRGGVRSNDWIKVKHLHSEDFWIVGWNPGQGGRASTFGSLILAERAADGTLNYAGNVGGGFSDASLAEVWGLLQNSPKGNKPFSQRIEAEAKAHWIEPRWIAEVRFAQRTKEGYLRHPVFLRLRPQWDVASAPGVQEEAPAAPASREDVLEQLDTAKEEFQIEVDGHRLKISSASKVLWPAVDGAGPITKRDYLHYLARVGRFMIPHLQGRPLAFVRFPDGLEGERFFQKHWAHRPDFVSRVDIWSGHAGRDTEYLLCDNLATLLWLGQIAALEIHPWYSRVDPNPDTKLPTDFVGSRDSLDASVLNYPDFMVIDLDPNIRSGHEKPGEDPEPNPLAWRKTVEAALHLRPLLDSIGLTAYLKTSGKTGLHAYVPLKRVYDYDTVKGLCETIGRHLLEQIPELLTMEWTVAKRPAKIFFDHNQNVRGKTLVSIYSPRPIFGAPVSFPVTWRELEDGAKPMDFTIANVPDLLAERGDLWADILQHRQAIAGSAG